MFKRKNGLVLTIGQNRPTKSGFSKNVRKVSTLTYFCERKQFGGKINKKKILFIF